MEKQKPKKRQTIADQIGRPMILFVVILILVNAIFLFLYALSHSIQDRFKRARQLGETTASELEDYECLSFLISYWREHYDSMELFYDNPEDCRYMLSSEGIDAIARVHLAGARYYFTK